MPLENQCVKIGALTKMLMFNGRQRETLCTWRDVMTVVTLSNASRASGVRELGSAARPGLCPPTGGQREVPVPRW